MRLRLFTQAEHKKLLAHVKGRSKHEMTILIASGTGMRLSEVLALRWTDLNVKNKTLSVQQSVERTRAGLNFKMPKTEKSRRTIPITSKLIRRLAVYNRREQKERAAAMGELRRGDGTLICPADDGTIRDPRAVSRTFSGLCKTAKVRRLGFHALRHTYATRMLEAGVPLKVVQELLGHSTIATTGDIYSHVSTELMRNMSSVIESIEE
jgi:integrase